MIDHGKVLRDAVVRHGIVVYGDGVEMLFAAVLNTMLENLGAAVAAALEACRDGHEEAVRRWRGYAKEGAAKILGSALTAEKDAASKAMRDAADKAADSVHEVLSDPVSRQREELDVVVAGVRRHAFLVLAAHGAMLAGVVFVLFL